MTIRLPMLVFLLALVTGAGVAAQVQTRLLGVGPTAGEADAFFSDSNVHEIRLAISTRDWQQLKESFTENTYYAADFSWRSATLHNVGIRSRGDGSRNPNKPGLRVDFDRYVTDQRFLGLKSFILRNNTQDASNMHERLAMQLFQRMGLPSLRESFARLYINNQFAGLYTIVESVDKSYLQRTTGENEGYLYEYDFQVIADTPAYRFEYLGPDPNAYVPAPYKPETHENSPRGEVIEQMAWAMTQSDDASFRSTIAEYIDLEKFVRYLAVEQFLGERDGLLGDFGVSNFYVYRRADQNLFTFIPWDRSESFKRGADGDLFANMFGSTVRNPFIDRVLSYQDLFNVFVDAVLECARLVDEKSSPNSAGWLEREIQREYSQIRDLAHADPVKPFTNGDFESAVSDLHEFAAVRSAAVNAQIEALGGVVSDSKATRFRRPDAPIRPSRSR